MASDRTVDALGLLCPLPVLKARKVLTGMAAGEVLVLLASDAMAQIDIPVFCREAGHEFLGMEPAEGGHAYRIRRGQG